MKIRLADYVADFLVDHGIRDNFSVVGGGAMHLNDALGHREGLHTTYFHHEQAAAIAAESYARIENRMAVLTVTTGPGGTNALTGVVGGWLDSIPMFVLSGQVRYDTTARFNEAKMPEGLHLRAVGDQEYDIVKSAAPMCKYAVMVEDPMTVRYHLERAFYEATAGRPGPVWIDIPVNFQGITVETDALPGFDGASLSTENLQDRPEPVEKETVAEVLRRIREAKRPVLYAGNGIRLSGGFPVFRETVEQLQIPVCTYWDSIDLIETDHPLYTGRGGNMGDRAGNFAVQNADLILAIGNRLPIRVTGFNYKTWAREAFVIDVDIDRAELQKPIPHIEMPVHADAKDFLEKMNEALAAGEDPGDHRDWAAQCALWKKNYPVVLPRMKEEADGFANAYAAFDVISRTASPGTVTVTSNGTCCVAGHQTWVIREGSRFINNNAIASMGYGLPASIGACIAAGKAPVICLEGDGSIMMNLQELQTIVTNRLPVKLFLINNNGYHSIRQTQNNMFPDHCKVGIGPESGDLSFPDFSKIFGAFGFPYFSVHENGALAETVEKVFSTEGFAACEIFVSPAQIFEPKSATKKLPDGTLVSPPLEDLAPFLPREELLKNLYIQPAEE